MPRCPLQFATMATLAVATLAVATQGVAQTTNNGPMSSSRPPDTAASAASAGEFDVPMLFANTCGWCHSGAGRVAGKGPQLMGTTLTDDEIIYRVKNGKTGAMPAFGSSFNDEQLKAIVAYIRHLKPEGSGQ